MGNLRKILIVDFMYLWNRVYAIKGQLTGAHIYDTLKAVDTSDYYYKKFIILDGENSTARRRMIYPDYKVNRGDKTSVYAAMDSFLKTNAVKLKTLKFIKNSNCEADDLITNFVKRYIEDEVYIYSGDTDLYQLLRFKNTNIGSKYSRGMIIEPITESVAKECYAKRYGLNVKDISYITKCKTFKGDTSDNIPIACPGMRTKTIDSLIENYWSGDEPLTARILYNMAVYLKNNGTKKEFDLFFNNRQALINNYKLTQLGYTNNNNLFICSKVLTGDGEWV